MSSCDEIPSPYTWALHAGVPACLEPHACPTSAAVQESMLRCVSVLNCKAAPVHATRNATRMLLSLNLFSAHSPRCACSGGDAPTAGPGLLLGLAEGGSYAAIGLGLAVLALQVCSHRVVAAVQAQPSALAA